MPIIKVKDYSGADRAYDTSQCKDTLLLPLADGSGNVPFSYGVTASETVALDFSGGDMTITPAAGQVANDEIIFCFEATAAVGPLTYLGLFDAKTGGKPFFTAELTSPISVAANTVPLIRRNQLVVALDKDAIEAY